MKPATVTSSPSSTREDLVAKVEAAKARALQAEAAKTHAVEPSVSLDPRLKFKISISSFICILYSDLYAITFGY